MPTSSPVARAAALALAAGAASTAAFLVLAATARSGIGLDSDSAQYLSAGLGLAHGEGLIGVDGAPYTLWPPLYPLLLAALETIGAGALDGARWLHAAAAAVTVLASSYASWRITRSAAAGAAAGLALLAGPALLDTAPVLWSEPVFLALSMLALAAWIRYREQPSRARFAALAITAAAALAQRYVGIALVALIGALLAAQPAGERLGVRLRRAGTFGAVCALPILAWLARNRLAVGNFDGRRRSAVGTLAGDLADAAPRLGGYLALVPWSAALGPIALAIPLACAAVAYATAVSRERSAPGAVAVLAFGPAYVATLLALRRVVEFDDLDARLLAPAAPSLAVAAVVGAHALFDRASRGPRSAKLVASLCIGAWAVVAASTAFVAQRRRVFGDLADGGAGIYERERWLRSPTVEWLRSHPREGALHTNEPFAVFCTTGMRTTPLPIFPAGFDRLAERLAESRSKHCFAWFTLNPSAVLPRDRLERRLDLTLIAELEDGEIWAVAAK